VPVASIIALMMEPANTSETSVKFYQTTWHKNPEDSHLQLYYFSLPLHRNVLKRVPRHCKVACASIE
jgi:hypothetical protein